MSYDRGDEMEQRGRVVRDFMLSLAPKGLADWGPCCIWFAQRVQVSTYSIITYRGPKAQKYAVEASAYHTIYDMWLPGRLGIDLG